MKDNNSIKDQWLHLRLSKEEYDQLHLAFSKTTEKKISRYARSILLGKPMIAGYRDLSTDSLVESFPDLLKLLNGIANNYNQSIHKLHTMDHFSEIKNWLSCNENNGEILLKNIDEIKTLIRKISSLWLQ